MYQISKEFHFSAGHHLKGLPKEHPCSRPHGHNYTVIISLQSQQVNEVGFVIDYRVLDAFKKIIDSIYDHQDLNEVVPFNPTAENLAKHFHLVLLQILHELKNNTKTIEEQNHFASISIFGVKVKETEKTSAIYYE